MRYSVEFEIPNGLDCGECQIRKVLMREFELAFEMRAGKKKAVSK